MSKEEVRAFKLFSKKMDMKGGRRDLELFDLIRKGGEDYDEQEIINQIYPDKPKNTYHRLRSRLLKEVNESLVHLYVNSNDTLKLYHLLSIADHYFKNDHYELAWYFFRKAEKQARKLEHFEALDIIYNEYIRLSRWVLEINPESYMKLRRENYEQLTRLRDLDDIVATVVYRIRITQNYGAKESSVIDVLQKTLDEFAINSEGNLSPRMRFRIYELISLILLERRDYEALEDYLVSTYKIFEEDKLFSRATHDTKLQMLTYIVNARFKTGHYDLSLAAAHLLGLEIESFDKLLYEKYLFFYYNALVINYFEKNLDKALDILSEMKQNPIIQKNGYYFLFVHMNEAIAWYNKESYKKAIRAIIQSSLLDGFKTAAPGLKLKIGVAELIIRYRLGDFEVIEQRIRQLRSDFAALLKDEGFLREKTMIKIISKMNDAINPRVEKRLITMAKTFIKTRSEDEDSEEIIDYNEFLKSIFMLK